MPEPVILVAGSLHYDIMVEADRLPRRDETAVGRLWYPKFGGKGGNQAVAAAAQGVPVRFLGAVGGDDFGRFLRAGLEAAGVDVRFLREVPGTGSGMSVAVQDGAGDYAATIVSGANLGIGPGWLAEAPLWEGVGLLVLQNEVPEVVNLAAAGAARARGARVILNAAPFRPLAEGLAALVDVLVVNAVEAEMMGAGAVTDLDGAAAAAGRIAGGFGAVIVTAGAAGLAARLADGTGFALPAERVGVVSSHGAGDAFVGALAAALAVGSRLADGARAASRAAARHVAGLSTRPA
ncbi:MAG: PfkB family carbohydrate kinase [Paracoccaceae bacterium]